MVTSPRPRSRTAVVRFSICAPESEAWTIKSFGPPPSFPAGALLTASVQVGSNPTQVVNAYLYPASQCNPAFKSCTNPF